MQKITLIAFIAFVLSGCGGGSSGDSGAVKSEEQKAVTSNTQEAEETSNSQPIYDPVAITLIDEKESLEENNMFQTLDNETSAILSLAAAQGRYGSGGTGLKVANKYADLESILFQNLQKFIYQVAAVRPIDPIKLSELIQTYKITHLALVAITLKKELGTSRYPEDLMNQFSGIVNSQIESSIKALELNLSASGLI